MFTLTRNGVSCVKLCNLSSEYYPLGTHAPWCLLADAKYATSRNMQWVIRRMKFSELTPSLVGIIYG